ncbi:MAG: pyridoxamine 5'-phosphate oxidase family protein [Patescibacteria group bacterium]|nr:pyridoxamine 5'-phosphate oxidase family protein [Patescibacteria group bacterium]
MKYLSFMDLFYQKKNKKIFGKIKTMGSKIKDWKKFFEKGKKIILVTSSKAGLPNANIVISLGFYNSKILIADCQMITTIKNLKENPFICLIGGYFKIKGKAEIFTKGKYFNICVRENKDYQVKHAILISIETIFDLDKVKKFCKN